MTRFRQSDSKGNQDQISNLFRRSYLKAGVGLLGFGLGGVGQVSADGNGTYELTAANTGVKINVGLADAGGTSDSLVYNVEYEDTTVVHQSRLGLDFADAESMDGNFEVVNTETRHVQDEWSPPYGEQSTIPESFTELTLSLKETVVPNRQLKVTVRAYDEGVAFRYTIPDQQGLDAGTVVEEQTEFSLPEDSTVYAAHGNEPIAELTPQEFGESDHIAPASISYADTDIASCLVEAAVDNYQPIEFDTLDRTAGGVVTDVSAETDDLPFSTPWRGFVVGSDQGEVFERNHLMLNLNEPSVFDDVSQFQPGKVIRCTELSTEAGKNWADFAVDHNLDYIHFDAGWYGDEFDEESDPTTPIPELDLQEVTQYAAERNVGVVVYINNIALENYDLDEVFPTYRDWGLDGLKFGFVDADTQADMAELVNQIHKAGEYGFIVNIHDAYYPSGLQRTYPNLMTVEAIYGDEENPTGEQNVRAAFNRLTAGPADHTWVYDREDQGWPTTNAHQLAGPVVYYSPMQYLYWYDGPSDFVGFEYPGLTFWDNLPTVWDDTEVLLNGAMGDYISVARKSGNEWFVGTLNDDHDRELTVPLSFLDQSRNYVAHIYENNPDLGTPTNIDVKRTVIGPDADNVTASLVPNGGQAIQLQPVAANLSFDRESWRDYFTSGESTEISTITTNEMRTPIQNGQVTLETPEGWQSTSISSTEFRNLPPSKSVETSWKVTPPEDANLNEYELSTEATYESVRDRETHQSNATLHIETPESTDLSFDLDNPVHDRLIESGETREISVSLTNTFRFPLIDTSLDLEAPDGWSVESISETTFNEISPDETVSAMWSVTAPADVAVGNHELTATATYTEANDREQVTDEVNIDLSAPPSSDMYLSDHQPVYVDVHGDLTVNESYDSNPIRIDGTTYDHGLGTHAKSGGAEVAYYLDGNCSTFSAVVGIDDETGDRGSCAFEVWGDGKRLDQTEVLTGSSGSVSFEVDITGVEVLKLVATDGGDGNSYDHADWAVPYINCSGSGTS